MKAYLLNEDLAKKGEFIGEWFEMPMTIEEYKKALAQIGSPREATIGAIEGFNFDDDTNLSFGEANCIVENWSNFLTLANAILENHNEYYLLDYIPGDFNYFPDIKSYEQLGRLLIENHIKERLGNEYATYFAYSRFAKDFEELNNGKMTQLGYYEKKEKGKGLFLYQSTTSVWWGK